MLARLRAWACVLVLVGSVITLAALTLWGPDAAKRASLSAEVRFPQWARWDPSTAARDREADTGGAGHMVDGRTVPLSSVRCLGRGADGAANAGAPGRACELLDVCMDAEDGPVLYFVHPDEREAELHTLAERGGPALGPPAVLSLASASETFERSEVRIQAVSQGLVHGAPPGAPSSSHGAAQIPGERATDAVWVGDTVALISPVARDANVGHLLLEDGFAAYALHSVFHRRGARGRPWNATRLALRRGCGAFHAGDEAAARRCMVFFDAVSKALPPGLPPTSLAALAGGARDLDGRLERRLCFKRLVVGTAPFGLVHRPADASQAALLSGYRCAVLRGHGLPCDAVAPGSRARRGDGPDTNDPAVRIVVTRKQGGVHGPKRGLCNTDEAAEWIQQALGGGAAGPEALALGAGSRAPRVEVRVVDWAETGTFAEQLALLSSTSVVVSPCGGVSIPLVFLPEGAQLIVTDFWQPDDEARALDALTGSSQHMEGHVWALLSHMTVRYYQITDPMADVELAAGTRPTKEALRNAACVRLERGRLLRLVRDAVRAVVRVGAP
ncbi:hypothetical protein FNF27_06731 [Cafeteria roenbergensis]|uniref:Uncharacterized protein n=1 Tax=Cafeteria roenbergensis TaxID=33653 RepID=A0A5A8CQ46_CAFRO|nr:hypothetical protein FNF28_06862 [Cafeteria roenbergensis]KAA0154310.1 hypothetical protein FNF29_02530 [Cafeteria roenbergensis]KAA0155533.1 hypothetical protein FNF31_06072 [Cafeteria roenbergensis]KAA0170139.1 hypothetical protein FNF27_06731 [Cafeteria roenbergensis]|eukprot:KAA0154310.1 hypothetical protein FNF29_02530 [Cafeteria roenbergensis]